jgi:two-component sensor histidine kinase
MAAHVRNLCTHLARSYGAPGRPVEVAADVADVTLELDRAVPCGLIINELVSNALKHAFPGGRPGRVRVALRSGPGQKYTLEVADNGVGLPEGLDPGRAGSLGLQLVGDLAEQLHGAVAVGRGAGTTFTITFEAAGSAERRHHGGSEDPHRRG